jgi:hypothetical protein
VVFEEEKERVYSGVIVRVPEDDVLESRGVHLSLSLSLSLCLSLSLSLSLSLYCTVAGRRARVSRFFF